SKSPYAAGRTIIDGLDGFCPATENIGSRLPLARATPARPASVSAERPVAVRALVNSLGNTTEWCQGKAFAYVDALGCLARHPMAGPRDRLACSRVGAVRASACSRVGAVRAGGGLARAS